MVQFSSAALKGAAFPTHPLLDGQDAVRVYMSEESWCTGESFTDKQLGACYNERLDVFNLVMSERILTSDPGVEGDDSDLHAIEGDDCEIEPDPERQARIKQVVLERIRAARASRLARHVQPEHERDSEAEER